MAPQYIGGFFTIVILNFVWWADWGRYVSSTDGIECFSLPFFGANLEGLCN
jgi:hypothetical protein